ncbi:F-box protein FBW2-like [Dendrobium catenatum]|nr:F-box protein FBW2-like [Dendrobium catenatum]
MDTSPEVESMGRKMQRSETAGGSGEVSPRAVVGDEWRYWEGLNHEVLALIFTRIPADELARTVPLVCRGWREAVLGPYCWSDIDIEEWCRRVDRPDVIDFAVRKLVRRSRNTLRRLCAYRIGNWGFSLTAYFGNHLRVLQIPMSEINDLTIQKSSGTLTALAVLDISYCKNITSKGILTLGKNCTSLVNLRRNMTPPEYESTQDNGVAAKINEDEALAIANTMEGIEQLELAFGRFSDHGLDAILSNCRALSSLDINGCWNVKLDGGVGMKCDALKFFKDPFYDSYELYPSSCEDDCDDDDLDEEAD